MIKRQIATFCFALATCSAVAQSIPNELECTIVSEYELTPDGMLKVIDRANNGERFMVNRRSGVIMGKRFSNDREKITVLDSGSSQQSFKMVSVNTSGYIQSTYLVINVFEDTKQKSFMISLFNRTVTGLCQ